MEILPYEHKRGQAVRNLKNRPKVFLGQPERGASSMPMGTGVAGIFGRAKKSLDKLKRLNYTRV